MKTDHLSKFNWTFVTRNGNTFCHDADGQARCGVKTRKGTPCKQEIINDVGRCRMHRGGAKRGIEHANFSHGKYTKYVPRRLSSQFGELLEAENLFDLTENVALLDVFIQDALTKLHTGGLGALWSESVQVYGEMEANIRKALAGNDRQAMDNFLESFSELGTVIKKGNKDHLTRQEILKITDSRRQLVKTKADIEFKGENALTLAQFFLILSMMEDLFVRVNRLEDEKARRQAYAEGLHKIINIGETG